MKIPSLICGICLILLSWAHAEEKSAEYQIGLKKGESQATAQLKLGTFSLMKIDIDIQFEMTSRNYETYLKEKYHIDTKLIHGITNADEIYGYREGFNAVMIKAIDQKHGEKFLYKAQGEAAYLQGKADAQIELQSGVLAIETMGLIPQSRPAYRKLLKDHCNTDLRVIAACRVNSTITGHAKGFNEVMIAEIEKQYGKGILEKLELRASENP